MSETTQLDPAIVLSLARESVRLHNQLQFQRGAARKLVVIQIDTYFDGVSLFLKNLTNIKEITDKILESFEKYGVYYEYCDHGWYVYIKSRRYCGTGFPNLMSFWRYPKT